MELNEALQFLTDLKTASQENRTGKWPSDELVNEAIETVIAWHEEREKVEFIKCENCKHNKTGTQETCFPCGLGEGFVNFEPIA